jgi:hypothetical protein
VKSFGYHQSIDIIFVKTRVQQAAVRKLSQGAAVTFVLRPAPGRLKSVCLSLFK